MKPTANLIAALQRECAARGDRAAVISIERLAELRGDLAQLRASGQLNSFQQYILTDLYQLDPPELSFTPRSILLVAAPAPAICELTFAWHGKQVAVLLPASYTTKDTVPVRVGGYLTDFLAPHGYQVCYAPGLPFKRLAVRAGLAEYGRNNITYVEGMGSFHNLCLYYSGLPCDQDAWRPVRMLDRCAGCQACRRACPTAAILPDRFLIDNQRCLPYFNEAGGEWTFPDWIDPAAHHTLVGCLRCQQACPADHPYLHTRLAPVDFSETETGLLLDGLPPERLPDPLREKLAALAVLEYLPAFPRNLRALLG